MIWPLARRTTATSHRFAFISGLPFDKPVSPRTGRRHRNEQASIPRNTIAGCLFENTRPNPQAPQPHPKHRGKPTQLVSKRVKGGKGSSHGLHGWRNSAVKLAVPSCFLACTLKKDNAPAKWTYTSALAVGDPCPAVCSGVPETGTKDPETNPKPNHRAKGRQCTLAPSQLGRKTEERRRQQQQQLFQVNAPLLKGRCASTG